MPDVEVRVLTTDCDEPDKGKRIAVTDFPVRLEGMEVFYCRNLFGKDVSLSLWRRLWSMIQWADVVHLSAVYSAPTIPTLLLCKALKKPVVWSPRGALQRWDGSTRRTTKRIWEGICNSLCDAERILLHFTSDSERKESSTRITNARAMVIANGIDVPERNGIQPRRKDNGLQVLFLGRLHPKKGIENLLGAMQVVKTNARLSICGDGDANYRQKLHALAQELGLNGRVKFHGRVDGTAKEQQFSEADLCVVPSYTENFCVVVAEALAHGVPVVASRGTPWQRLAEMDCGLWVDNSSEELSKALDLAASLPLAEMGKRGRDWMGQEYSWERIAEQMAAQYQLLIERTRRSVK